MTATPVAQCPLCARREPASVLAEAGWIDTDTESRIRARNPHWLRSDGACPACVQSALLALLLERGEAVLGQAVQQVWPFDADAAFGALPTPLRMRADPRFTGAGVTVAVIDSAFHPHDDLVRPVNRIRAWVDATEERILVKRFQTDERPEWPGSDGADDAKWHGLMTSLALAGNGWRSHGLYRGLAADAELVLVQVQGTDGHIGGTRVARALRWLLSQHKSLGVRVVNVSLGVAAETPAEAREIHEVVESLVAEGVSVVVASGNDGSRSLSLPATAPLAITVGGLDDRNVLEVGSHSVWHSNYGAAGLGHGKPELVAPSTWIVAPVLPGSAVASEASALFTRRSAGDATVEARLAELKLVTPFYQHVEGTSFASPIVSSVVACMLEAMPSLPAWKIRAILEGACHPVSGASMERQGAGAIDAGRAVAAALAVANGTWPGRLLSPRVTQSHPHMWLYDLRARRVELLGSWNNWQRPGAHATLVSEGVWNASPGVLPIGRYEYKLLLDDTRWIADPLNPRRQSDGTGGWNSVLEIDGT